MSEPDALVVGVMVAFFCFHWIRINVDLPSAIGALCGALAVSILERLS